MNPAPENLVNQERTSVFETEAFKSCWYEHLASKFNTIELSGDFVVHPKPVIKGVFNIKELRLAGWNTAWYQALNDKDLNPLKTLLKKKNWDILRVIVQEDTVSDNVERFLKAEKLPASFIMHDPEYYIDIHNGWDNYLQKLPRKARQDIQRLLRQAEPLTPRLIRFETDSETEEFLNLLFQHHQKYWHQKGEASYFEDEREQAFCIGWARSLMQSGNLHLEALLLDDEIVNLTMDIVYEGVRYGILMVNTGLKLKYQPMLLGLILKLQQAQAAGVSMFDIGFGQEAFKKNFANLVKNRIELIIPNSSSWIGKGYAYWLKKRFGFLTME